jgi:dihydrodipicolinate synthase/N-acetylneuraminate lyase
MLTRENYRGLVAYPPTPFTETLALDEDALRVNIRKLIRVGVDGILLAGTSGEFFALAPEEYNVIVRILREETRDTRVYSAMAAYGLCPEDTIRRTHIAMENGIDAVLAMQPHFHALTTKELVKFWEDFCGACPDIGVIINHYGWVRQAYTVEICGMLAHIPNLVGTKEAHWDFNFWRKLHRESPLAHMSSTDAGWLVVLHQNKAVGVGSPHICLMPHVVRRVLDLCNQGRYLEAEGALAPLTEFVARMKLGEGRPHVFPTELEGWQDYSNTARHKALVDAFGFLRAGPPRPPYIAVPIELQENLRRFIANHYPALLPPANTADGPIVQSSLWRVDARN